MLTAELFRGTLLLQEPSLLQEVYDRFSLLLSSVLFRFSPKVPEINITDAYKLLQIRGHSDTMDGMDTVKFSHTEHKGTL